MHLETFKNKMIGDGREILPCLPANKFDIVQVSIPAWHAHLSPHASHVSQYPSGFKDSMAQGEQAVRQVQGGSSPTQ